jgi:hypothetical protein
MVSDLWKSGIRLLPYHKFTGVSPLRVGSGKTGRVRVNEMDKNYFYKEESHKTPDVGFSGTIVKRILEYAGSPLVLN